MAGKSAKVKEVDVAPSVHHDPSKLIKKLGKKALLSTLERMLLIRNVETRAEAAYLQGHIGGFFHSYIGQEAIQTAAVDVMGPDHWYVTTYRCHALALLLGATPNEIMAEFYGRETGNALGRGGSMHLFTDRLLGGYGIVGGHLPIATGAAFSSKYKGNKDELTICFLGDGAVAQGAFHESLNLAALWDLPCIYVIENNQWGMGTAVDRAISVHRIAESKAPSYGIEAYTLDGMDYFNCYQGFAEIVQHVRKTSRPVLVEAITQRFKGHSISDPGLYRSKEELACVKQRDPIHLLFTAMEQNGLIDEEKFKALDKQTRQIAVDALEYAEQSPWPDPATLEQGVFAPQE